MIHCRDVEKLYRLPQREVRALVGASLDIEQPGFYAIMGTSGSGKSTLLHLLAGLDTPDAGEIEVAGRKVHLLSDKELTQYRRHDIGIVFQQLNLIPTLSAFDNVMLPGLLAGKRSSELVNRARELLDRLGIGARGEHRPDAMSGGEQQRVAIARALLFSPRVLFADEPTGNLDSRSSEKLWRLLGEIASERDTTVVMVTHEPAAAVHCKSVFLLHDGRVSGVIETDGLDAGGIATRYQQLGGSA